MILRIIRGKKKDEKFFKDVLINTSLLHAIFIPPKIISLNQIPIKFLNMADYTLGNLMGEKICPKRYYDIFLLLGFQVDFGTKGNF